MRKTIASLAAVVLCGAVYLPSASAESATENKPMQLMIEIPSPLGFDETLERIENNAKAEGWKVPKKWKVNFQKNLMKVTGRDIGKNQVLKMCEPEVAADLMVHDELKHLSAMMPCTIAVYEKSDGKTYVSMMNMRLLSDMYGEIVAKAIETIGPQMEAMLTFD
jgi:uncharacterized protein (DUF302 family)